MGNLSSSALRDVCKLLYLSDIGADDLLVGRINTKLDGKVKLAASRTQLSNSEKKGYILSDKKVQQSSKTYKNGQK